ncbi:15553_t:CDS:2 [Gigaspora margarita]|uniref:15553_t:CDS:1 n=1 Tax=Gigaspora margarita TaxID=4874 RepID=A0ABN7UWF8_GIGMA|nr:15553_t:CDS:2 [Gigaspora margarita]
MGVSEAGSKQDLVSQLVNESRKRNVSLNSDGSGKGKAVDVDRVRVGRESLANIFGDVSVNGSNLGTKGYIDRLPPHKALFTGDVEYVQMARQLFSGKRKRARVVAQQFPRNKSSKISDRQSQSRIVKFFSVSDSGNAGAFNIAAPSKQVVYYLCEGQGHYANKYGPREQADHTWMKVPIKVGDGTVLDSLQVVTGRLHAEL